MEDICNWRIQRHAIYLIHDNGKRIYEHGLNPFESFKTLDETIYDIEVTLLNIRFGKGVK